MNEASQATDSTEALTAALGRSDLARAVERLAGVPVLVLGDIMLDRFVYGTVERISPEAPIPVLRIAEETAMLGGAGNRSEEHTSELQSLMRISYAVFCLKKKKRQQK